MMLSVLAACAGHHRPDLLPAGSASRERPPDAPGNVLVLLLDEIGIDKVRRYGIGQEAPPTPSFDALADQGVTFLDAYVTPSCSPTRAALLTGRTGRRTGVGRWMEPRSDPWSLPFHEVTIPEMLRLAPIPYATSLVGKWHLVSYSAPEVARDPLNQGFDWYAGPLANLTNSAQADFPKPRGYYRWEKDTNGVFSVETGYATVVQADDAVARIHAMPEPWFLEVAFSAAHLPLDPPPEKLAKGMPLETGPEKFDAVEAALDTEMGRVLAALPPEVRARTTIIALGDNGTPHDAIAPPLEPLHGKETVWELGVRVPLVIAGPGVATPGSRCEALVDVFDLFPTVAELAGVDLAALTDDTGAQVVLDGQSLVPYLRDPAAPSAREVMVADRFFPNGPAPHEVDETGARDRDYKLRRRPDGTSEMYRLAENGLETGPNLLAPALQTGLTEELASEFAKLDAAIDEARAVPMDAPDH